MTHEKFDPEVPETFEDLAASAFKELKREHELESADYVREGSETEGNSDFEEEASLPKKKEKTKKIRDTKEFDPESVPEEKRVRRSPEPDNLEEGPSIETTAKIVESNIVKGVDPIKQEIDEFEMLSAKLLKQGELPRRRQIQEEIKRLKDKQKSDNKSGQLAA